MLIIINLLNIKTRIYFETRKNRSLYHIDLNKIQNFQKYLLALKYINITDRFCDCDICLYN